MTFLETRYMLKRELAASDSERLSRLSTVYGVRAIAVSGSTLLVEYDASRIHEAEVLAQVRRAGIPAEPPAPIPPGAFDHAGPFRDFAWPTLGLSPVHQKAK